LDLVSNYLLPSFAIYLAIVATSKMSADLTFNAGFAIRILGNLNPTCAPGYSVQSTKAEINMTFTDIVHSASF